MTFSVLTPFFRISMCHPSSPIRKNSGYERASNICDISGCRVCFYLLDNTILERNSLPSIQKASTSEADGTLYVLWSSSGQGLMWHDSPRGVQPSPHSSDVVSISCHEGWPQASQWGTSTNHAFKDIRNDIYAPLLNLNCRKSLWVCTNYQMDKKRWKMKMKTIYNL
jgi:hypothetical protein